MNARVLIGIVIVLVIVGVGGWYAVHTPAIAAEIGLAPKANTQGMASSSPAAGRYRGGAGMRGGFATGSIEVLTDNGFTITLQDGTTKDVTLAATTTLLNYVTASSTPATTTADQLSVGEQVRVIGMAASDGSIDARRVETGNFPAFTMGTRNRNGGGQGSGSPHPQS